MAKEYILKSDAHKAMLKASPASSYLIDRIHPVEVREIVYADWVPYLDGDHIMPDRYYKCSHCGSRGHQQLWRYCPSCASTMRNCDA